VPTVRSTFPLMALALPRQSPLTGSPERMPRRGPLPEECANQHARPGWRYALQRPEALGLGTSPPCALRDRLPHLKTDFLYSEPLPDQVRPNPRKSLDQRFLSTMGGSPGEVAHGPNDCSENCSDTGQETAVNDRIRR
jgi:hypothetical protein